MIISVSNVFLFHLSLKKAPRKLLVIMSLTKKLVEINRTILCYVDPTMRKRKVIVLSIMRNELWVRKYTNIHISFGAFRKLFECNCVGPTTLPKFFSHDSVLLTSKQKKQETDKRKQIRRKRKRKRKASVHLSYDDFERSTIKRKDDVLITTTTFVCSYFSIFTLFPFFQFRVYVDDFNTGGSG